MTSRRLASGLTALALTLTAAVTTAGSPSTAAPAPGTRSLATALAADGHHLDRRWDDFDIFDKFLGKVLRYRPHSKLALLTHGRQFATVFMPTDRAYRRLGFALFDHRFASQRRLFRKLWFQASGDTRHDRLDVTVDFLSFDTVEGEAFSYRQLRRGAPAEVLTLQGGGLRIRVRDGRLMVLDREPDSPPAHVIRHLRNFNRGNHQLGQGIDFVVSPVGQ